MKTVHKDDVVSKTPINRSASIEMANRKIIAIKINMADGMTNNVLRRGRTHP
jgi:hypothetical protein